MPTYLYKTTFVEIPADKKWNGPKTNPHELVSSGAFKEHLNEMGAEGWRLISVEALNVAETSSMGYAFSFTKGYFFFWMKENVS